MGLKVLCFQSLQPAQHSKLGNFLNLDRQGVQFSPLSLQSVEAFLPTTLEKMGLYSVFQQINGITIKNT